MDLENFKAFDRFTVHFRDQTVLVGPNNAGKSTLIAALRASAGAVRILRARKADSGLEIEGSSRAGHYLSGDQMNLTEENLRHEFRDDRPTRIVLTFRNDARLELHWSAGEKPACFCFLAHEGVNLTRPREVRRVVPRIGVVPVLAPMQPRETVLSREHIESHVESHRVSTHARNQLYLLQLEDSASHANRFDEFKAFAAPLIPELSLERMRRSYDSDSLDLEFRERASRNTKEISWAGDGMQVWLQLLYHLFRLREAEIVVLDEPDLFLHADVQRRLVEVLDQVSGQFITATHSPEILAEARQDAVVWISKDRRQGKRAPDPDLLFQLSQTLGTQFNLRLARALRAQSVVFVEGKDMRILRNLAAQLSADAVVNETGIAVISLEGFDRWEHVEPFQWMVGAFLENVVDVRVILDRDYRDDDAAHEVIARLDGTGIRCHVWARHELENYLLNVRTIVRVSGAPVAAVDGWMAEVVETFEAEVREGMERARLDWGRRREARSASKRHAHGRFQRAWADSADRPGYCPGKELISRLNQRLAAGGFETISSRRLSRRIRETEIPAEMSGLIREINREAADRYGSAAI